MALPIIAAAGAPILGDVFGKLFSSGANSRASAAEGEADQYVGDVKKIRGALGTYTGKFAGSPDQLNQSYQSLANFDPYQGSADFVKSLMNQISPQFRDAQNAILGGANARGAYRAGDTVRRQVQNYGDFSSKIADALANYGTQRTGLALQAKEGTYNAASGLADRYEGGLAGQSQLSSGLADFYQSRANAARGQAAQTFGAFANAGATLGGTMAGKFFNRG